MYSFRSEHLPEALRVFARCSDHLFCRMAVHCQLRVLDTPGTSRSQRARTIPLSYAPLAVQGMVDPNRIQKANSWINCSAEWQFIVNWSLIQHWELMTLKVAKYTSMFCNTSSPRDSRSEQDSKSECSNQVHDSFKHLSHHWLPEEGLHVEF